MINVSREIRDRVHDRVEDLLIAQVEHDLRHYVGRQLWDAVGDILHDQVRNELWDRVHSRIYKELKELYAGHIHVSKH